MNVPQDRSPTTTSPDEPDRKQNQPNVLRALTITPFVIGALVLIYAALMSHMQFVPILLALIPAVMVTFVSFIWLMVLVGALYTPLAQRSQSPFAWFLIGSLLLANALVIVAWMLSPGMRVAFSGLIEAAFWATAYTAVIAIVFGVIAEADSD